MLDELGPPKRGLCQESREVFSGIKILTSQQESSREWLSSSAFLAKKNKPGEEAQL